MLSLLIVAAEAPTGVDTYLPLMSTLGSLGFAVWYAWYTTTVSIPKMLEAHRTERAEMQARFDAMVERLVIEMREQREHFIAWQTSTAKGSRS